MANTCTYNFLAQDVDKGNSTERDAIWLERSLASMLFFGKVSLLYVINYLKLLLLWSGIEAQRPGHNKGAILRKTL